MSQRIWKRAGAVVLLAVCVGVALRAVSCVATQAREQELYNQKSEFTRIIVTEDPDGRRILRFGDGAATQSIVNPADPTELLLAYTRTSMCALAIVPQPKRVLIVGLGGGSMPMFLRHYYPDAVIDAVELDPGVVDVAKRFFAFKEDPKMKAYVADGRKFIETTENRYDLIFLDAYGEDSVPYALATKEFLQAVRAKLTEKGIAVSNLWGSSANPLYPSMIKTHQAVFDEVHVIQATPRANRIVLAFQDKPKLTAEKIEQMARAAPPETMVKLLDLPKLVREGYEPIGELPGDAKVLLDKDAPKEN